MYRAIIRRLFGILDIICEGLASSFKLYGKDPWFMLISALDISITRLG